MKLRTIAAAAALLLALGACSQKKTETRTVSGTNASGDTVVTLVRVLHHETTDCRLGKEPCLTLDMTYPILLVVPGGDTLALNRDVRRRLNGGMAGDQPPNDADPESVLAARFRDFDRPMLMDAAWYDDTEARVVRFVPALFTLSIRNASYTGGAHPNGSTVYVNLDPRTAREVPLDSVLVPGAMPAVVEAAERAFRRARSMPPDSSLEDAGFWFKNERFELTPNYALTDDGLVFFYNSYEVGPYSEGPTLAVVPWLELGSLVRPAYQPARDLSAATTTR